MLGSLGETLALWAVGLPKSVEEVRKSVVAVELALSQSLAEGHEHKKLRTAISQSDIRQWIEASPKGVEATNLWLALSANWAKIQAPGLGDRLAFLLGHLVLKGVQLSDHFAHDTLVPQLVENFATDRKATDLRGLGLLYLLFALLTTQQAAWNARQHEHVRSILTVFRPQSSLWLRLASQAARQVDAEESPDLLLIRQGDQIVGLKASVWTTIAWYCAKTFTAPPADLKCRAMFEAAFACLHLQGVQGAFEWLQKIVKVVKRVKSKAKSALLAEALRKHSLKHVAMLGRRLAFTPNDLQSLANICCAHEEGLLSHLTLPGRAEDLLEFMKKCPLTVLYSTPMARMLSQLLQTQPEAYRGWCQHVCHTSAAWLNSSTETSSAMALLCLAARPDLRHLKLEAEPETELETDNWPQVPRLLLPTYEPPTQSSDAPETFAFLSQKLVASQDDEKTQATPISTGIVRLAPLRARFASAINEITGDANRVLALMMALRFTLYRQRLLGNVVEASEAWLNPTLSHKLQHLYQKCVLTALEVRTDTNKQDQEDEEVDVVVQGVSADPKKVTSGSYAEMSASCRALERLIFRADTETKCDPPNPQGAMSFVRDLTRQYSGVVQELAQVGGPKTGQYSMKLCLAESFASHLFRALSETSQEVEAIDTSSAFLRIITHTMLQIEVSNSFPSFQEVHRSIQHFPMLIATADAVPTKLLPSLQSSFRLVLEKLRLCKDEREASVWAQYASVEAEGLSNMRLRHEFLLAVAANVATDRLAFDLWTDGPLGSASSALSRGVLAHCLVTAPSCINRKQLHLPFTTNKAGDGNFLALLDRSEASVKIVEDILRILSGKLRILTVLDEPLRPLLTPQREETPELKELRVGKLKEWAGREVALDEFASETATPAAPTADRSETSRVDLEEVAEVEVAGELNKQLRAMIRRPENINEESVSRVLATALQLEVDERSAMYNQIGEVVARLPTRLSPSILNSVIRLNPACFGVRGKERLEWIADSVANEIISGVTLQEDGSGKATLDPRAAMLCLNCGTVDAIVHSSGDLGRWRAGIAVILSALRLWYMNTPVWKTLEWEDDEVYDAFLAGCGVLPDLSEDESVYSKRRLFLENCLKGRHLELLIFALSQDDQELRDRAAEGLALYLGIYLVELGRCKAQYLRSMHMFARRAAKKKQSEARVTSRKYPFKDGLRVLASLLVLKLNVPLEAPERAVAEAAEAGAEIVVEETGEDGWEMANETSTLR